MMTHKEINKKHFDGKCPVCNANKKGKDPIAHTESGGKLMAEHYGCHNCGSYYTIGFKRGYYHVESEISIDNFNKLT